MSVKFVHKKWRNSRPLKSNEMKNLMARLYRLFENHPEKFRFEKINDYRGYINYEYVNERVTRIDEIVIDFRNEVFRTLVHECFHYFYPHWQEDKVRRLEERFIKTVTPRQVKNLLYRFSINVCNR